MLALIKNGEFISQHIEGSRIDLENLTVMPAEGGWEYEDYSLSTIAEGEAVPEGFYLSSQEVSFVGGSWIYINSFLPIDIIDPLTLPITKRQMLGVLADNGIDAEPIIDGAIEAIEDTPTRAKYRNDWRYAGSFVRQHPLFNDPAFMALLSMTTEQIDTLWVAAQDYPA